MKIRLITMVFSFNRYALQALRRQAVLLVWLVWPSLLNGGRKLRNTACFVYVSFGKLYVRFLHIFFLIFVLYMTSTGTTKFFQIFM